MLGEREGDLSCGIGGSGKLNGFEWMSAVWLMVCVHSMA